MDEWQQVQRRLARVRRVANLFDSKFAVPGTRIRFGLDSLVGLLPGVGDLAGAAAGVWLIAEAAKLKAPLGTLAKMGVNLAIDLAGGTVPIAGDIFDLFWRSNQRNVDLLQKHIERRFPDQGLSAD
ncbi:MAG: DUF4112 domain-containing protein [Planctomycetota bacterium]